MLYKFQFTKQRYARRIKIGKDKYFEIDVNNGFFSTEDDDIGKELRRIASTPRENVDNEMVDLTETAVEVEKILSKSKNVIVAGARSSKVI